jgi:hypothetical protein
LLHGNGPDDFEKAGEEEEDPGHGKAR